MSSVNGWSLYSGVVEDHEAGIWQACVLRENGLQYAVGYYDAEEDAARGYDRRILKEGVRDQSWLNFPIDSYTDLVTQLDAATADERAAPIAVEPDMSNNPYSKGQCYKNTFWSGIWARHWPSDNVRCTLIFFVPALHVRPLLFLTVLSPNLTACTQHTVELAFNF